MLNPKLLSHTHARLASMARNRPSATARNNVQIRPANAASQNTHRDLSGSQLRNGPVDELQRFAGPFENYRFHGAIPIDGFVARVAAYRGFSMRDTSTSGASRTRRSGLPDV